MLNIIWFLVGFIIGMFTLLFVFVCYEEHYTIKLQKYTPVTDEQYKEIIADNKIYKEKEQEQKVKSIKFPNKRR